MFSIGAFLMKKKLKWKQSALLDALSNPVFSLEMEKQQRKRKPSEENEMWYLIASSTTCPLEPTYPK